MNVRDYISSGILEAYVTGGLTEKERADVEQNVERYPELREELRLIENAQEELLKKMAIEVSREVKESLLDSIGGNDAKVVPLNSRNEMTLWKWVAAASVLIALFASYLAIDYRSRWQEASRLALENKALFESMASNYNRVKSMEEEMKIVSDPSMKKVVMHGTNNAPAAMATVYWGESSEHVYLKVNSMKTLDQGSQYQLWAMIDGKPVDAGVFDASVSGMIKMKNIGKGASAFAVTIEPRGGNSSPTVTTMQVLGNV